MWDKEKAAIVNAKGLDGKVMYRETDQRTVDDVWRISMLQPADRTENCGFPTQKPEALLHRILEAASSPGDLVADFFCGSGTMLSVARNPQTAAGLAVTSAAGVFTPPASVCLASSPADLLPC